MDDTQAAKAVSSSSDRSPSWSVTIKAQIQHQALNNAQFHPSPAASSTFGFLLKSPQFWITKAANSKKWLWKQTGLLGWFMSMNQTAVVLHTICFWAPFPPLSSCQGYSAPLLCCTSTPDVHFPMYYMCLVPFYCLSLLSLPTLWICLLDFKFYFQSPSICFTALFWTHAC